MTHWNEKHVALLGYGIDTHDVEAWLRAQGANITILDEKQDPKAFADLTAYDVLVRSPGVYRFRKEIVAAEQAGVLVTSKMKIFFDVCPTKHTIGITGTKGKGTTSMLIYEMLKAAGKDVYIGGNIGKGIFTDIDRITSETYVVLELSSFQLFDLHRSPAIAVTLMITSDHLDWHKDHQEYLEAKSAITRFQELGDVSVYNDEYPSSVYVGMLGSGKKIPVRRSDWVGQMRLRGEHNRENLAAAAAVAREIGISEEVILRVAGSFLGLPHRLQEVATKHGVTYYDDSISTTPASAIAALGAFHEPTVLILGGSEKGADFHELAERIAQSAHVLGVVFLGTTAKKMYDACVRSGVRAAMNIGATTMQEAVNSAQVMATPGSVVVLSPACASFDMFEHYKDRGDQFQKAVLRIQDKL